MIYSSSKKSSSRWAAFRLHRLGHATGALDDINCIVTSVGKNDPLRLHEVAAAVLGRILCSADRVRIEPSWYRHDWEQQEWERYLNGDKKACASQSESCLAQARRLSAHNTKTEMARPVG